MKQILFFSALIATISCHVTYPGTGSPYGSQQGLFIPQVTRVQSISSATDVIYTRFCKAVCMLYVPEEKTCGLNNYVYLNDCQARCDRMGTDKTRLMFNDKCCCTPGSEYIDSAWAKGNNFASNGTTILNSDDPTIKSSSFCVSTTASPLGGASTVTGKINVFAIPPCLTSCLGITSVGDLKFVDQTKTYVAECDDGVAN